MELIALLTLLKFFSSVDLVLNHTINHVHMLFPCATNGVVEHVFLAKVSLRARFTELTGAAVEEDVVGLLGDREELFATCLREFIVKLLEVIGRADISERRNGLMQ